MATVQVKDLLEYFDFKLIAGEAGLSRKITTSEVSRPSLEMTGYFKLYSKERLQFIGNTEIAYFEHLSDDERRDRLARICTQETPGIIFSKNLKIPQVFIEEAEKLAIPLLQSSYTTTQLISHISRYLQMQFAPKTAMHGVLVDVYGVGVLITGKSGVGKSETALDLIKRGHRLVADDCVDIRQDDHNDLIGSSPPLIEHHLEIRGLGIINVMSLFGAGSVVKYKKISLIVHLELWEDTKQYDRLGLDEDKIKIMDVYLPKATIPVRPGRNLAVMIEVAAMNFRLKRMGVHTARNFSNQLSIAIENDKSHLD